MGISRSSTCALAYLMIYQKMTAADAIRTVRLRRDIRPNDGFLEQLADLCNELRRERQYHLAYYWFLSFLICSNQTHIYSCFYLLLSRFCFFTCLFSMTSFTNQPNYLRIFLLLLKFFLSSNREITLNFWLYSSGSIDSPCAIKSRIRSTNNLLKTTIKADIKSW